MTTLNFDFNIASVSDAIKKLQNFRSSVNESLSATDRMRAAQERAQRANMQAASTFRRLSQTAREYGRDVLLISGAGGKFVNSMRNAERAANRLQSKIFNLNSTARALAAQFAAGIGFGGVGLVFREASRSAQELETALAEISTLSGSADMLSETRKELERIAVNYGVSAVEQAKAYYNAVSAGAEDGAEAVGLLEQANMLATGGVTSVDNAMRGLSAAMNAYKRQGLTAAEASDALFVGMKGGITTIGQLSQSIGQVVGVASTLNVPFDELVASISTITTEGVETSQAVTRVRAALSAVLGPSAQASKLAGELGLEFNAAAVKSQGFAKFLQDVIDKTGGNEEALTRLFGSVEAVQAVLALGGSSAETFASQLEGMANKAGETTKAFELTAYTTAQVFASFREAFANELRRAGDEFNQLAVPIARLATEHMPQLVAALTALSKVFAVLAVGVATRVVGALIAFVAAKTRCLMVTYKQVAANAAAATSFRTLAVAIGAASGAARVFGAIIGFLGGPIVGFITLMASLAAGFYLFRDSSEEAAGGADVLIGELDSLVKIKRDVNNETLFGEDELTALERAALGVTMIEEQLVSLYERLETVRNRGEGSGRNAAARQRSMARLEDEITSLEERRETIIQRTNELRQIAVDRQTTRLQQEEKLDALTERVNKNTGGTTANIEDSLREIRKFADGYGRVADAVEKVSNSLRLDLDKQKRINSLLSEGKSIEEARAIVAREFEETQTRETEQLRDQIELEKQRTNQTLERRDAERDAAREAADEARRQADAVQEAYNRAGAKIEDVFRGVFRSALDGFDSFEQALKDQFKNLLVELALTAAKNAIVIPIVTSAARAFGIGGNALEGLIGGLGGGGGGLSGLLGVGGLTGAVDALSGSVSALQGLFSGGATGSFFGGFTSQGLMAATPAIAAAAAAAIGQFALGRSLARDDSRISPDAQGAAALLGGPFSLALSGLDRVAGGNIFGTKYRTIAEYLNVEVQDGVVTAMLDTVQKGKRSLGRGSKYRTLSEELVAEAQILQDTFTGVTEEFSTAFSRLRGEVANFDFAELFGGLSFSEDVLGKENPLGLAIRSITDDAARRLLPFITEMQREGESAAQALLRVVNAATALRGPLSAINSQFAELGEKSLIYFTEKLSEAAGGTERLAQLTSQFMQSFYTEAERAAITTQTLTREFAALGLELPASTQAYRDLVDSISPTDEEAQGLLVRLLELAPAFAEVAGAVDSVAAAAAGATQKIQAGVNVTGGGLGATGDEPGFFGNPSQFDDAARSFFIETNREQFMASFGRRFGVEAAEAALAGTVEQIQTDLTFALELDEAERAATAGVSGGGTVVTGGLGGPAGEVETSFMRMQREEKEAAEAAAKEAARLAAQLENFRTQAQNAFLPLEELVALRTQEFADAARELNVEIPKTGEEFLAIGDAILPLTSQFQELLRLQEQLAAQQAETSADTMFSLTEQRDVAKQLRDYLDDSAVSEFAGDPVQRLDEALRQFREARALGFAGDPEAAGSLTGLADTVLALGRDVFASGAGFVNIYDEVRDSLSSVAAGLEGDEDAEKEFYKSLLEELRTQNQTSQAELRVAQEGYLQIIALLSNSNNTQNKMARDSRLQKETG